MAELSPSYDELVTRVDKLEAERDRSEWALQRLANVENPRDKILLGLMVQLRGVVEIDRFHMFVLEGGQLVPEMLAPGQAQPDPVANAWVVANPAPAIPLDVDSTPQRAFRSGNAAICTDYAVEDMPPGHDEWLQASWDAGLPKLASLLFLPLQTGGESVGLLQLGRFEEVPFTNEEIAALQPYADQMALAIGNARAAEQLEERNRQLAEALEQQTAMAEVLSIIANSATNVQPVFEAVVERAVRLCAAHEATLQLIDGDEMVVIASMVAEGEGTFHEPGIRRLIEPGRFSTEALVQKTLVRFDGTLGDFHDRYPRTRRILEEHRLLSALLVPLKRRGEVIGVLGVTRSDGVAFGDSEAGVVQAFADQAVIAIENARLFNELQDRNRQVNEALERQTATAEVLNIISRSPTDLQPVLDTIAAAARRLLLSDGGTIWTESTGMLRLAAVDGKRPPEGLAFPPEPSSVTGRAFVQRQTVHLQVARLTDEERAQYPLSLAVKQEPRADSPYQVMLAVPMLRQGAAIGVLVVVRNRDEPYSEPEIEMLRTFADQAVIAIENARLFSELQERNRDVTEALDQQTAMANILGVISRSPTDLDPVLDAITEASWRLFDVSGTAAFWRPVDGVLELSFRRGADPS